MRLSTPVLAWAGLSRGRFSSGNVVLEDGRQESRRVGSLHHRWKLEKETAVRICVSPIVANTYDGFCAE